MKNVIEIWLTEDGKTVGHLGTYVKEEGATEWVNKRFLLSFDRFDEEGMERRIEKLLKTEHVKINRYTEE